MEIKEKIGVIEAILFASGEPMEIYRLSQATGIDPGGLPPLIRILNERYDDNGSGITIKKLESSYQMCTREKFAPQIRAALETKRSAPLSNAAMEVLTIIAYNQPVTKGFVESVRGVDSAAVVNSLVEKGLLEEAGRLDVPGRPVAFRTTANFLRCFGLTSLDDLPPLVRDDEDKQTTLFEGDETDTQDTDENNEELLPDLDS